MRNLRVKGLLLGVALLGVASPLTACGLDMIQFPGTIVSASPRDNHVFCVNDQNHILVLDLLRMRSFDLGPVERRRWDGDVADGQALLLSENCLHVVELAGGKTVHEVAVGDRVHAFGFAGQGRAFLHYGYKVAVVELATGETLQTIKLGENEWARVRPSAWQKVGDRLFVTGPDGDLCVIDLTAGKLSERFQVESRAGIAGLRVEGDLVYCVGSHSSWAARIDHLTCVNLKTKRITECELPKTAGRTARLAGGPKGTVYLIDRNQIDRFDRSGPRIGTSAPQLGEGVQLLTVWMNQSVIATKGAVLFLDVNETAVTSK